MKDVKSRRLGERLVKDAPGRLIDRAGNVTDVKVKDISSTGARIEILRSESLPKIFYLSVKREGDARAAEVVWRSGGQAGIRYIDQDALPTPALQPDFTLAKPSKGISLADLRKLATGNRP